MFAGHHIHAFVLSAPEYQMWQTMAADQKFAYVRSRTNPRVFDNNRRIVGLVVQETINVLDSIFEKARAQAQVLAKRRVQRI